MMLPAVKGSLMNTVWWYPYTRGCEDYAQDYGYNRSGFDELNASTISGLS